MVDLSVKISGVEFKNPIIGAACPETKDRKKMIKTAKAGAGGLVAKTMHRDEFLVRYPFPRFRLLRWKRNPSKPLETPSDFALYSRDVMIAFTPEEYIPQLKEARKVAREENCVFIGSVMGRDLKEWATLTQMMDAEVEPDMIECDSACPHTAEWAADRETEGRLVGANPRIMAEVTKVVKENSSVPVIMKLTPETADMIPVAKAAKDAGADALTVMNRYMGFSIDIETGRPEIDGFAGVGGPWGKPLALRWIGKITQKVDIPIFGNYGVCNWEDAIEFMMAGANAVQVCTAVMVNGYAFFRKTAKGIEKFMERKNFKKVDDFVGLAHKNLIEYEDLPKKQTPLVAEVNTKKCTGCARCPTVCFYDAIKIVEGKAAIDPNLCIGCILCEQTCPVAAISMRKDPKGIDGYLRKIKHVG